MALRGPPRRFRRDPHRGRQRPPRLRDPDAVLLLGAYAVELTVTSGDQHNSDRATITAVSAGAALEPGGVVEGVDGVSVGATPGRRRPSM